VGKGVGNWQQLSIRLVGSHPLWGHYLWNAAKSFAFFLDLNSHKFCKGKNVLELGAGGGLPSLVAGLAGAKTVVATDYPDTVLIQNLEHNLVSNLPSDVQSLIHVQGYRWGSDTQALLGYCPEGFDVILMSDLIFNHSQHEALLLTCDKVLRKQQISSTESCPCLLVFYTHHRPHLAARDLEFFHKATEHGWLSEKIVTERMGVMFPNDSGDEDSRATVHGWRLWRSS